VTQVAEHTEGARWVAESTWVARLELVDLAHRFVDGVCVRLASLHDLALLHEQRVARAQTRV
jgi:hypothetical protein